MSNPYVKLANIQQNIKVLKQQNNTFAGFKYRSAEDIIEKLKPQLAKEKAVVILSDKMVCVGGKIYVKATAQFIDLEGETVLEASTIEVSAYAREEDQRPKMSEGQLTGAASSYARKCALNGLLLLDDNKDPDSQDNSAKTMDHAQEESRSTEQLATPKQRELITKKLAERGVSLEEQKGVLIEKYGVDIPLTLEGAKFVISELVAGDKG